MRIGYSLALALVLAVTIGNSTQRAASPSMNAEKRAQISEIQWGLLQAKLDLLKTYVDAQQPRIDVPTLSFDQNRKRILAVALIDVDRLNEVPVADVKNELNAIVTRTLVAASGYFDEKQLATFRMEFRGVSLAGYADAVKTGKRTSSVLYAEYEHASGKLIIH